jgi:hypothetical protein
MGKKDNGVKMPNLFRVAVFLLVSAGLVWWLSSQVEIGSSQDVSQGEVKGEEATSIDNNFKNNLATEKEIIKKINQELELVLPEIVKKQVDKINQRFHEQGSETIKSTEEIIKETKLAEEIEKIILQTTNEIEGFPEKQKKEIKKEAIKQVCDALMEEIEKNEDKN